MKAADVARIAFEKLVEIFGERTYEALKHSGPERLVRSAVDDIKRDLRRDFEQAIISLRFDVMGVQEVVLDMQTEQGKSDAREAYERGKAIADGMDITVVDPDGTEHKS